MPVLMPYYQVLILHYVIMACVLALRHKAHAFSYYVKGEECIFLMVNHNEITGQQCDITYCIDHYRVM